MKNRFCVYDNQIAGLFYGHVLGDAVGYPNKFKFGGDNTVDFPYAEGLRGQKPCTWSETTDQMILIMQSLIDCGFRLDEKDFVTKLQVWSNDGFVGNNHGGLGNIMKVIVSDPDFLTDPHAVAKKIWENTRGKFYSNGSLTRASILGAVPLTELQYESLCKVTHFDPRCVASCIFQSSLVSELLTSPPTTPESVDKMLMNIANKSRKYLDYSTSSELSRWVKTAYTGRITELELSNVNSVSSVFKTLACSIYTLQVIKTAIARNTMPSFKKVITKIASEGGDANVNCAIAGGILGAYLGYSKLPNDWIDALPDSDWLAAQLKKFIAESKGDNGEGDAGDSNEGCDDSGEDIGDCWADEHEDGWIDNNYNTDYNIGNDDGNDNGNDNGSGDGQSESW